jgi:[glutamine synthetase] adenylyltransferase / [glutamine synthetase]-adenylyl-L-tyrosine phosphorylase
MARLLPDENVRRTVATRVTAGPDPTGAWERLLPMLEAAPAISSDEDALARACAIAGSSRALSRIITRHPSVLIGPPERSSVSLALAEALTANAGGDLAGVLELNTATAGFSDSIDAIVGRSLTQARHGLTERHPLAEKIPFAVIAMGKWGGRELNYASDIDLVFAHETVEGEEEASRRTALALASRLIAILTEAEADGPRMVVDADLRPEGKMGPLSRSLDSYTRYYRQWGEPWELQALLRARPAAGDPALGSRFMAMVDGIVWEEGLDGEALRSIRKLKEQVEQGASVSDVKRARGGIRDIEFSVQLLQLVHGRNDDGLRSPATLPALDALHDHGLIDTDDRDSLANAYRFLRNLEHRIQLWDLRQTHELPTSNEDLTRLGRSMGFIADPIQSLAERVAQVRAVVRDVHERLYFRPILDALVGSPSAKLGVEQAGLRLEALGFADVNAARAALAELTTGLNRRSRAMHQILPLMLDWLSLTPNPDLGLAQLRNLLARTTDHSTLVTLLQTNPLAGERLCTLLGTSRLIGDLIDRIPEFIPRLADDRKLSELRGPEEETRRLVALIDSRPEPDAKIGTVRRFARRRKLRVAARDIIEAVPVEETMAALTGGADATVSAGLHIVTAGSPAGFSIVAMGKWGGSELSYGSDLDLLYVYDDEPNRERGIELAVELARVISEASRHGEAYSLDAELRPEGRRGPLARSLDGYRRYYLDWAEPWEKMAMVKARGACGDEDLNHAFFQVVDAWLWQTDLRPEEIRSIREVKARVEKERIPAGEDPDYHLKLGLGAITDIEFVTQLLQLRYGRAEPSLRVTGTLAAIGVAGDLGILSSGEAKSLVDAYLFCTRVRLRLHLQAGRAVDWLPGDLDDLGRLAASLGYVRSSELREDFRRVTRRSRHVFQRRFFD